MSLIPLISCCVWKSGAQTEFKRVAEANVTLPCHHRLGLLEPKTLDIEWLLQDSEADQKVVITYSGGNVYNDLNDEQKGRVSFASNFLAGDASLEISYLQPSDAGQYTCKVKNAGQYEWTHITLKVLEKPSTPKCWIEGEMSEGRELTLQCNSVLGTAPIKYEWQRISDKEGKAALLPSMAQISKSLHPQILSIKNNPQKNVSAYARSFGMVAGAVCGVVVGFSLVFLTVWLTVRRKEKKRYEEEEAPNEIKEDAEAPKARLVKPGSSSSGSRSSRSGSSSTRSTANSASRSQRTLSTEATPHITPTQYIQVETREGRETEPKKINQASLVKIGTTPVMAPAQSRAFQTV
uniref:CXADR like membrane protein n=1 Tax=Sphenodon punctatus TaxID=8508 RepID=A0A8D0L8I2_SPHPU